MSLTRMASSLQAQAASRRARARCDEEALAQCAADAGVNVIGCVFVEVWALSDDGTALSRPNGGHWMDPSFAQSLPSEGLVEEAWSLDREAEDCPPGAGLAGTLADDVGLARRAVYWRQLKRLMEDPFVQRQSGNRMARLYKVGIGLVAAVPFQVEDDKGLVLFYSRFNANWAQLNAKSNERYMLISADLIGANYASRKAREASAQLRRSLFKESVRKVMKEMRLKKKKTRTLASMVLFDKDAMERLRKMKEEAAQGAGDLRGDNLAVKLAKGTIKNGEVILKRVNNSRRKWGGANLHGPPRHSFTDCLFTFTGCFVSMLLILRISKYFRDYTEFNFEPGWYASTLCIVHAMTPAPVGQPRQIFGAHVWNMLVGLACRQLTDGAASGAGIGLSLIHVQALSVALGVSGQAFLGIMHPPASGLSLLFASNPHWTSSTIIPVMLVDAAVVFISVIFLNLSDKKQYPLFWLGLGWQGSGGTMGYLRSKARSSTRALRDAKSLSSEALARNLSAQALDAARKGKGSIRTIPFASLTERSSHQQPSTTGGGYNTMEPSSHNPHGHADCLQWDGSGYEQLYSDDVTVLESCESFEGVEQSPEDLV